MNLSYKKLLKRIIIFILEIMIVIFGINIITLIRDNNTLLEIKIFTILLVYLPLLVFILIPLLVYYASKITKKRVLKESLSKIDFKKTKDYYRDILKNHTPLELSYIDNFKIDYFKDVIATILSLKLKKKIVIKDNIIDIIDNNVINLSKSEIYILESIKDGKVVLNNCNDILDCVKEEAINNSLILKNKVKRENDATSAKFMFIGIALFIFVLIFFYQSLENLYIIMVMFIIFGLSILLIAIQKFYNSVKKESYFQDKNRSYKRTSKGKLLNYKIEGLKVYLEDFSKLSEKEQDELILWDEYLIYSVIFNQNKKIIDELSSLIAIEEKDY